MIMEHFSECQLHVGHNMSRQRPHLSLCMSPVQVSICREINYMLDQMVYIHVQSGRAAAGLVVSATATLDGLLMQRARRGGPEVLTQQLFLPVLRVQQVTLIEILLHKQSS